MSHVTFTTAVLWSGLFLTAIPLHKFGPAAVALVRQRYVCSGVLAGFGIWAAVLAFQASGDAGLFPVLVTWLAAGVLVVAAADHGPTIPQANHERAMLRRLPPLFAPLVVVHAGLVLSLAQSRSWFEAVAICEGIGLLELWLVADAARLTVVPWGSISQRALAAGTLWLGMALWTSCGGNLMLAHTSVPFHQATIATNDVPASSDPEASPADNLAFPPLATNTTARVAAIMLLCGAFFRMPVAIFGPVRIEEMQRAPVPLAVLLGWSSLVVAGALLWGIVPGIEVQLQFPTRDGLVETCLGVVGLGTLLVSSWALCGESSLAAAVSRLVSWNSAWLICGLLVAIASAATGKISPTFASSPRPGDWPLFAILLPPASALLAAGAACASLPAGEQSGLFSILGVQSGATKWGIFLAVAALAGLPPGLLAVQHWATLLEALTIAQPIGEDATALWPWGPQLLLVGVLGQILIANWVLSLIAALWLNPVYTISVSGHRWSLVLVVYVTLIGTAVMPLFIIQSNFTR